MIKAVSKSWRLLSRREKIILSFLAALRIITNFVDVIGIALIGVVGALSIGVPMSIPILGVTVMSSQASIVALLVAAGFAFVVKTIGGVILSATTMNYLARVETRYSGAIIDEVFSPHRNLNKLRSEGEIIWVVLHSTAKAFIGILGNTVSFVAELSLALAIFVFLLVSDLRLALVSGLYFLLVLAIFQRFSRRAQTLAGENFTSSSVAVTESLSSLIRVYREVAVVRRFSFFLTGISEQRQIVAESHARNLHLQTIPRLVLELALILGALAYAAVALGFENGTSSLATMGTFLVGSLRLISALLPLQRAFQYMRFEGPAALAAQEFLTSIVRSRSKQLGTSGEDKQRTKKGTSAPPVQPLSLRVEGISFGYHDQSDASVVLKNVSFNVEPGARVALVGQSGSGKSTLLEIILGLQTPDSGSVLFSGESPKALIDRFPGIIGYVPQRPQLIPGTLAENIALGVPIAEIDLLRVAEVVRICQLEEVLGGLDGGIAARIGKHGDNFSGGQIQRIGIARALYPKPRLLILDEATTGLDAATESAVSAELSFLSSEMTLLVVTHSPSVARTANPVVCLAEGEIVAVGSFEELAAGGHWAPNSEDPE